MSTIAESTSSSFFSMSMKERISASLLALKPVILDVIDESENHRGHGGWREGGETHYRVLITSLAFVGQNRVSRHRMVNALLAQEFARGLHALAISAKAPGED